MIAASFAFGSTQTFQSEVDAYKNYPQLVIALKNAYHKFLKEGIAPIAASGQFGTPLGCRSPDHQLDDRRYRRWPARYPVGDNNADNTADRRRQRHVAAGGAQRGDLGDRRDLLPL